MTKEEVLAGKLLDPWVEDDRFLFSDWRLEVVEENTVLGYAEWVIHQYENEIDEEDFVL